MKRTALPTRRLKMISENERLNLQHGDIVARKFRGTITKYVIAGITNSRTHFWVRDLRWGNDGYYDENHILTEPKWSVVSMANNG